MRNLVKVLVIAVGAIVMMAGLFLHELWERGGDDIALRHASVAEVNGGDAAWLLKNVVREHRDAIGFTTDAVSVFGFLLVITGGLALMPSRRARILPLVLAPVLLSECWRQHPGRARGSGVGTGSPASAPAAGP